MFERLLLGFVGMLLLFYGMRFFIDRLARHSHGGAALRVFNIRQVQENVIRKSSTLSISSILILAALCCFGAGIVIAFSNGNEKVNIHIMDYTFENYEEDQKQGVENVKDNLKQTIYKTIIPRNVRLAEAPSYGLPINLYDKRSSGTEAYRMLADEVIENAQ